MWGNFSKLLLHISFTAVKINGGIGKGIGGIWNGKFQNVNIILPGAVWRVWRAWRAWRKRKLKPWPPNNFPNVPQKMFPPCPKKFFFATRSGLMLLWFTDLMNVTEKVTIHRPNVSTLLSSAFIRGDLNAATRGPFIWSLISGLFSDEV